MVVIELQ